MEQTPETPNLNLRSWQDEIESYCADLDNRISDSRRYALIALGGSVVVALGMVATGRLTLQLARALGQIAPLAHDHVGGPLAPTRASTGAPTGPVVDESVPEPAPRTSGYDPGPQEAPERVKETLRNDPPIPPDTLKGGEPEA